jgi:predicted RNA-binding Zn-ribbon protein involved in translation (DUF1610 family)
MELADIIACYRQALEKTYASSLLPSHHAAMDAILRCRTSATDESLYQCSSCGQLQWHPHSCGHRSCPQCQNHEATQWLERQREKLLPVDYFLVTFTLPAELRPLAWSHQRAVYAAMFAAASETLKAFGLNPKHLGADIGMTAVLQTNSRRLTYHPHLHVIVPGGGVDRRQRVWKRLKGRFLFNEFALATVFRGKMLHHIEKAGLYAPAAVPNKWVVDCTHVGRGESALEYLSRYLYRGVISKNNILGNHNGQVTFRYTVSKTGETRTETLPGEKFLWRVIQHVLPRGFHRVRNYGFLHHNARKTLQLVQLILKMFIAPRRKKEKPSFRCSACGEPMINVNVMRLPGQRRKPSAISHAPPSAMPAS